METFVLRVWTPGPDGAPGSAAGLCGVAEHVGGGRRGVFLDGQALLRFIEESVGPSTVTLPEPASTSEEET